MEFRVDSSCTDAASEGGSSDGGLGVESPVGPRPRPAAKKRKPTYYVRKEEKAGLEHEIEELRARLRYLEEQSSLREPLMRQRALQACTLQHDMQIAGTESLLSLYKASQDRSPLEFDVHLTADSNQRQRVMKTLHGPTLDRATKLMVERIRYLDLRRRHRNVESFDLKNGDHVVICADVTPFEGPYSIQEVVDEFLFFIDTQEISISENLGLITVSEVEDASQDGGSQCRLLSSIAPGVDVEMNLLRYCSVVDTPPGIFGQPYAVAALDYVNTDDLYPYQPTQRIRRDISAAVLILVCPREDGGAGGPIVSMARWAHVRMHHHPEIPLNPPTEALLRESIGQWDSVMPAVMSERLARKHSGRRSTSS